MATKVKGKKDLAKEAIKSGQTCHYERIEGKWYVVCSDDFPGDESGKQELSSNDAILLELGYQQRISEEEWSDD